MVRVPLRGGRVDSRPPFLKHMFFSPRQGFTTFLNLKGDYTNLKLSNLGYYIVRYW
jgi:hypothetical protein